MIVNKITVGYVIQRFDTDAGKFTAQDFIAGDECDYEDLAGNPVDSDLVDTEDYLPYDMVQPN